MTEVYGTTFNAWQASCPDVWDAYTRHAFVDGLQTGELPRAAYLHYLIQDYIFLVHFARAWSLAVVKAETVEEMKTCAATVDALVNHEMGLHVSTCQAAGIAEETLFEAEEEVANLAYTRFVMDAGLQGDFLDLMAALAPCVFGYAEIGLRLRESADPQTPYADWIATYADPGYQAVTVAAGQMLDKAVARRLGDDPTRTPSWPLLERRFAKATQLEVGFWDMGLQGG